MSTNLVSLISNVLTPELVAKVAAALGIDPALAQKAVSAAVPALLGSFAKAASTPDGARKLFDTATSQSPDLLSGLAGMIGGSGQQGLVDTGNKALAGLLGPGASSSLGDAVSKFAGLSPGQGTSLVGALAPAVLGVLGQQARSGGLDASSFGKMLSAEAPSILGALPPGLSNALSAGGLLGVAKSAAGGAGDAVRSAGATTQAAASAAARTAAAAPAKTGGLPSWAGWVAGLIVLILAGWWLFGGSQKTEEVAKTAADTATNAAQTATEAAKTATETATNAATDAAKTAADAAADAAKTATDAAQTAVQSATEAASGAMEQVVASIPELSVGGVDVAATANQAIGGLKDALGQIKDADTAKAALPKIEDASAKLGQIEGVVAQLPAAGKTALATALAAARPSIDALFDKVLTMPGVAEVAKPAIDGIRAKLDAITKPA